MTKAGRKTRAKKNAKCGPRAWQIARPRSRQQGGRKNRTECAMGARRGPWGRLCVSAGRTHANLDHCLQLWAPANYALGFQAEQAQAAKC